MSSVRTREGTRPPGKVTKGPIPVGRIGPFCLSFFRLDYHISYTPAASGLRRRDLKPLRHAGMENKCWAIAF